MTDIRRYVDHQRESGCPVPPYVTITDDHIRAIHARMLAMGLLHPAPTSSATPCPICTMPMDDVDGGCVRHDSQEIAQYVKSTPGRDIPPSAYTCTGAYSFANFPIKGWTDKTDIPAPTSAVDDEATVRTMHAAMPGSGFLIDGLRSVLAAIRRGEVPGLMMRELHDIYRDGAEKTNDAIKAEVERLRAELESERIAAQKMRSKLTVERDAAIARAEAAEACIGTLRDLLGCTSRNVADCTMKQHSREIMSAAIARADENKEAFPRTPEAESAIAQIAGKGGLIGKMVSQPDPTKVEIEIADNQWGQLCQPYEPKDNP